MTPTPQDDLETKLAHAHGILSLPERERERDMLKLFPELVASADTMLRFHKGYAREHQGLLQAVFVLLGTITAFAQGRFHWVSEVPAGTAGPFRRAVNALIKLVNERLNS